jgi:hypothetical protein
MGRRGRNRLYLQLPVPYVPITTQVVSSNTVHGEVHSIQHNVIKSKFDQKILTNLQYGWLVSYCIKRHIQQYVSYIPWWSFILVEETRVSRENHLPLASH